MTMCFARKRPVFVAAGLCASLIGAVAAVVGGDVPDPGARAADAPAYSAGVPVVALGANAIRAAGIRTAPTVVESIALEDRALATVVELGPLLDWRARFRAAHGARDERAARTAAAVRARDRLQALHRAGNSASARRVEAAEAEAAVQTARLQALSDRVEDLRAEALARWGGVITGWLADRKAGEIERLVRREQALLQVTLAPGHTLGAAQTGVVIDPHGARASARPARRIDAAPGVSGAGQGETWWFETSAERLRAGMTVDVWIAGTDTLRAVRVPERAVVWYGGRPWVYLEIQTGRFARRDVGQSRQQGPDRLVEAGLDPGVPMVVVGAQLLLSEEMRSNIPDEEDVD